MTNDTNERGYKVQDLSIGEILDHALYLCRDNWLHFGIIALITGVPFYLISMALQAWLIPDTMNEMLSGRQPDNVDPMDIMLMSVVPALAAFMLYVVGMPLMLGAITHHASMAYFESPVTVWESIKASARTYPVLVVAAFLYFTAVGIGSIMCLVPGILAQCAFILYLPLLVVERCRFAEVFSRSQRLMKSFMIVTFVAMMAMNFFSMPVGALSTLIGDYTVQNILNNAVGVVMMAFQAVFVSVIYAAARCRHEHLDLDLLVSRVDVAAEPAL